MLAVTASLIKLCPRESWTITASGRYQKSKKTIYCGRCSRTCSACSFISLFQTLLGPLRASRGAEQGCAGCEQCSLGSDCPCFYALMSHLLQLHSLQSQLEFQEQSMVQKSLVSRQEAKIRELETKLEYERTQIKRLEVRHAPVPWKS